MKKSVRIRKAQPGETPGYKNKTKQFIQKANLGMNMTSANSDQSVLTKLYDQVYTDLKFDTPKDVVFLDLQNRYGLDEQTALMLIYQAILQLTEEGYMDPNALEAPVTPQEEQQQQAPNQEEMSAEDQEQEELALSDFGYYDEDEDDRSHIDQYAMSGMEEDQQGESFGGYYQDGGMTEEQQVLNQYGSPGNLPAQKPFSIEDLIAMTPGVQSNAVFPDISSYVGNYRPTQWSSQNWLAKKGGSVPKLPKYTGGGSTLLAPFRRGYNIVNKKVPIQNMSPFYRATTLPFTALGLGMQQLPWIGSKFQPRLDTSFTQNAYELPKVLMGEEPTAGVFSRGSEGWSDGSFIVDRLEIPKEDVISIINEISEGTSSFTLNDIILYPKASIHGSIGGVYPLNSKISSGMDDSGNRFFDISYKFKPGEKTAHGFAPLEAKETTFRNRFYYGTSDAGELQIFDNLGTPLLENEFTASLVKRPIVPSLSRTMRDFVMGDMSDSDMLSMNTASSMFFNRSELTSTPPIPYKDLSWRGRRYRDLEQWATGSWVPSMFGYNPIRTRAKNITEANIPSLQYTNPASQATYPLGQSNYAQDINNATNYLPWLGAKTFGLGLGLGYGGYQAWDYFMNPCQCEDPTAPNYMPKDGFNKCPCGTDVGDSRILNPENVEIVPTTPIEQIPNDTLQELIDRGMTPEQAHDFYFYSPNNPYVPHTIGEDPSPPNKKKGGNVSKKKFVNRLVSIFDEGGANEVGQGVRMDTNTKEIEKMKSGFLEKVKRNSDEAISKLVYEKAKNHPQIMEKLMADGYKENLAEEAPVEAKWGMNINTGGYVDMGAENPLTKFIYGGLESDYYEPYDIPVARDGLNVLNRRGEIRGMQNMMNYDDWLAAETNVDDWESANPEGTGEQYDEWLADFTDPTNKAQREQEYKDYQDFWHKSLNEVVHNPSHEFKGSTGDDAKPRIGETNSQWLLRTTGNPGYAENRDVWDGTKWVKSNNQNTNTNQCPPGYRWSQQYNMCAPVAKITPNYIKGPTTAGGLIGALLPFNKRNKGYFINQTSAPYYVGSGQPYTGNLQGRLPTAIKVNKSNRRGIPLEYTKYYGDVNSLDNDLDVIDLNTQQRGNNIQNFLQSRKDKKYQKYLGDQYGEDYWYGDRGENPYTYKADEYTPKGVYGKRAQRQLDKTYAKEDRSRFKQARQYDRNMRRADRRQAQNIRRSRRGEDFGYGGYAENGIEVQIDSPANNPHHWSNWENVHGTNKDITNPNITDYNSNLITINDTYNSSRWDNNTSDPNSNLIAVDEELAKWKEVDRERDLLATNALIGLGTGLINRSSNNRISRDSYEHATDLFSNMDAKKDVDTGDYSDTSGIVHGSFRWGDTGSSRNSRATFGQYGGYMEQGGTHKMFNGLNMRNSDHKYYEVDEEVYMTPEEIEQYLAAGGQIEYL